MRITTYLLVIFLISCVTADKDNQNLKIKPDKIYREKWLNQDSNQYSENNFSIEVIPINSKSKFIPLFFSNLIVDDIDAAMYHLSANYIITISYIENQDTKMNYLSKKNLKLKYQGETLYPLLPSEYPSKIHCINWKGNLKNLYNATVVTFTTAYIVGAITSCFKEGDCAALNHIDKVYNLSRSGEKNPEKSFSNPIYTSEISYVDLNIINEIPFNPYEKKSILSIYKRPLFSINSEKFMTPLNCIVQ